jgi:ATP-dependent helicase HrpB
MKIRPPDLPVLDALPALKHALAQDGLAVLAAPPGSGKTTVAPLALLDEPWLAGRKILLLEPRRLAARASAARMAFLLGEKVGQTVGYQIRFERKISKDTRIEVITEGLLARRLQSDPELPGTGLVIFDEFHERSLDVDLALALTLDARANLNPDLRVLVMSATLDTVRVAALLGGAPVIESGGRLHPVSVHYRVPKTGEPMDRALARTVLDVLPQSHGDVLAFLPGAREIRGAQRELQRRIPGGVSIHPLYGDLTSAEQDAALRPAPDGHRKVILATNIAQTSLTVEGVNTVVDSGFVRVARFDAGAGANRLDTVRVSRASADQRAGRAGRLGPGACYRLWSEEQHSRLPAHDTPEILAADLSRFALELAAWGVTDPAGLALMDAPPASAWSYAQELLRELEALGADGRITAHGRAMARLPASPRLAHMLIRAQGLNRSATAAWIAAALEARDSAGGIDLDDRVRSLRSQDGRVRDVVRQLLRMVEADDEGLDEAAIGRLVALAYPERIARRRAEHSGSYLCEDGGEARLPETDPLAKHEWLAIAHWDPAPPRRIRLAAVLSFEDIEKDHAGRIRSETAVHWDARMAGVVAESQRRLGAIVLSRRDARASSGEAVRAAMLEGIRSLGLDCLPWSEAARQWQARVLSLRSWRPDENWPDVSDNALLAALDEWLAPWLDGVMRREHLSRLNLMELFNARLDYPMQQKLAKQAPTHLEVPTGSRIALEYFPDGRPPVLAVKLQELFGMAATPAVNGGRTPVLIHLLSPGQRPLAVTQDLAGFWTRTYPEVKREMKGRYPRHPWPDDPLSAAPTRRTKRRGE